MPLRDHFRPPLDNETSWEGVHATWPALIALALNRRLSSQYVAAPRVHHGAFVELDVAAFAKDNPSVSEVNEHDDGGVAVAVWAPPQATLSFATDLPAQDEYEVRVYDERRGRRLVAAIEIVSPANKDRPENRHAFVAKCASLLQHQVSIAIIDLVTTRQFNLYEELLELVGQRDPSATPTLYAAACRAGRRNEGWQFDTWAYPLTLGKPLPTLPLWLADDYAVPLELEPSYEETCRGLRVG